MRYTIKRECWNSKTYNGYEDNPYWRITFSYHTIGLSDDGTIWSLKGDNLKIDLDYIVKYIENILNECKIQIKNIKLKHT